MIDIVPFRYKLLPALIELHESQKYMDIACITMKTLPKTGYMALMGGHPIAAGFLRRVEPCFAQLDTLVSNAHFGSNIRHEGVKAVVDALLLEAKRLKLEGLIATTHDAGVLKRAEELGFHVVNQKVIALALKL